MAKKRKVKIPGLHYDGSQYIIDKVYKKIRIYCRTGTDREEIALRILDDEKRKIEDAKLLGKSIEYTLEEALLKYFKEATHKSVNYDIQLAKNFNKCPQMLKLPLDQIHNETLAPYIKLRRDGTGTKPGERPVRNASIARELSIIVRVLRLAARSWRCVITGKPWLNCAVPLITTPKDSNRRTKELKKLSAYPLSWSEQEKFFKLLPDRIRRMAVVAVNTGKREQEICQMTWQEERYIPALKKSVFVIPKERAKNGIATVLVPNHLAMEVINGQRGLHDKWVWPSNTRKDLPFAKIRTNCWINAWKKAGLPDQKKYRKGVHNLRHTCSRRLRAGGVGIETRKDILGHKSKDITTHYSAAEIKELFEAVEKITVPNEDILLETITQNDGVNLPNLTQISHDPVLEDDFL